MKVPTPIQFHLRAVRDYLRSVGLSALVIQSDGPLAVPARPILLCPHCKLPEGSAGPHGACRQSAEGKQ